MVAIVSLAEVVEVVDFVMLGAEVYIFLGGLVTRCEAVLALWDGVTN